MKTPGLNFNLRSGLLILLSVLILSGCASVPPGPRDERDPFESYNRAMHSFNEAFDESLLKPVSTAYKDNVPQVAQTGVSNFFSNIDDFFVFINDLLQFKFSQAASDLSRLVWNTTVGLGGLIDVATHMDLPKHNEDFGQTLGAWGIGDGPYFVIPFLGPSTIRDTAGITVQAPYHPVNDIEGNTEYWATVSLMTVDTRAQFLGASKVVDQAALDSYVFIRDAYLQRRRSLVYDGNPPREKFEDGRGSGPTKEDLELELELERELQSAPKP